MPSKSVLDWLLEERQPSVRYYALRELLGRGEDDPGVKKARSEIGRVGWAADQLRSLGPKGYWEPREPTNIQQWWRFTYFPKFRSTNWRALVLADMGLDSRDARIGKIAGTILDYRLRLGSPFNYFHEEVSISGNTARMLTRFGYGDDPRVRRLYDWLVEDQREDGGWNGEQGAPGTLEGWEALAAFACVPKSKRPPKMTEAINRGAEFYLQHKLFEEGGKHPSWFRLHYPTHYFYDILVGLDILTQLGYSGDRRLKPALELLNKKRRQDGTWVLESVHPDTVKGSEYATEKGLLPLVVEPAGRPSKWITLTALRVLKRVKDSEPGA